MEDCPISTKCSCHINLSRETEWGARCIYWERKMLVKLGGDPGFENKGYIIVVRVYVLCILKE